MAYKSLIVHLLISAPSDVPASDLAVVRKTISQWNVAVGRALGLTVLPVSWTEHAAAEFGDRPQAILNEQIVNDSDLAIVLFCDRLGTPTGEAESGTAEEIAVLSEAGKSVAILANMSPRAHANDRLHWEERGRLIEYLGKLREKALVLEYSSDGDLIGHLNNFLARGTARSQKELARWHMSKQEWSEAADALERHVALVKADWETYYLLGMAHANRREGDESDRRALSAYTEAIAKVPWGKPVDLWPRLYSYRSGVNKRLELLEDALDDATLAKQHAVNPYDLTDAIYNQACVLAMLGCRDAAIRAVKELKDLGGLDRVREHLHDYFKSLVDDPDFRELLS